MTRRARLKKSPSLIKENRQIIWKRALFLFVLGMILYVIGWAGDILHYYGVYLFIGSLFIAARGRMLLWLSVIVLIAAQSLQLTYDTFKGWNPKLPYMEYLDFWTFEGFFRNLMFNGYHPVLPWICFFLFGMWIGRLNLLDHKVRMKLLVIGSLAAIILECFSAFLIRLFTSHIGIEAAQFLFNSGPILPNIIYMLSASSTALIVLIFCLYFAERFAGHWFTKIIVQTGQLTLTHYVSHVVIGIGILTVLNRLGNQTLSFALGFSVAFFAFSIILSVLWRKRYRRGPLELLMRKLTD